VDSRGQPGGQGETAAALPATLDLDERAVYEGAQSTAPSPPARSTFDASCPRVVLVELRTIEACQPKPASSGSVDSAVTAAWLVSLRTPLS